jgi:ElaB/YqjD/DUF883 family membrane-anchored ribosome-binding protein
MQDNTFPSRTPNIVDQVADSASHVIHNTQQAADNALGGLDHKVQALRQQAAPRLDRASERASEIVQQGAQSVRDTTRRLREQAVHVSAGTRQYVRDEPVKSVLIAAAAGALLMGLVSLLARPGR